MALSTQPQIEKKLKRGKIPKALRLIAIFKLIKAFSLLIIGLGALSLVNRDIVDTLESWVTFVHVDPDNRYIHLFIEKIGLADDSTLKKISAGTFFYATLLLTEGIGLWFQKRWAEFLTAIITASFIPIEVYELIRRFTFAKIILIIINVAILWYLIVLIIRGRHRSAGD